MRLTPRSGIVVLVAGGLVLWFVLAWFSGSSTSKPSAPVAGTPDAEAIPSPPVGTAADMPVSSDDRRSDLSAAPADDADLHTLWSVLAPGARRGDPIAACQLATATVACAFQSSVVSARAADALQPADSTLRVFRDRLLDPAAAGGSGTGPSSINPADRRLLVETLTRCPPPTGAQIREARRFLRAAAQAGVPDAQALYVVGEPWMFWGGDLDDPIVEAWRSEAPAMLQRMLGAGHPDAPAILSQAYGRAHVISGLFAPDPVREAAYAHLSDRIAGRRLETSGRFSQLTPDQLMRARQISERLHERHYAGRRFDKPAHFALPSYRFATSQPVSETCRIPSTR